MSARALLTKCAAIWIMTGIAYTFADASPDSIDFAGRALDLLFLHLDELQPLLLAQGIDLGVQSEDIQLGHSG